MKKTIITLILIFIQAISFAQVRQIDSTKIKIVKGITRDFLWHYVSYDRAKEMTDFINQKLQDGGYDTSLNIDEFTFEITKDLRNIGHDQHIFVCASHDKKVRFLKFHVYRRRYFKLNKNGELEPTLRYKIRLLLNRRRSKRYLKRISKDKFSYGQIKVLPGNIGYFEIYNFEPTSYFRKENRGRIKFKSVMRFLKKCNSIIIDLRSNTGGLISLSDYFSSYFMRPNTYFITTSYRFVKDTIPNGRDTTIEEKWYTPQNNNFKFTTGKDIYILTSHATFSAAELTTYALKRNSDVKVIGEATRGGGNGHFGGHWNQFYYVVVPEVKVFDEENNNYSIEGKGIKPDILVRKDSAMVLAYTKAHLAAGKDTLKKRTKYYKSGNEKEFIYNPNRLCCMKDTQK